MTSLNDRVNSAIATLESNAAANTADTTRFAQFMNQATGYTTTLGQYVKSIPERMADFSASLAGFQQTAATAIAQFQLSLNAALAGFNATAAASEAQRQADYSATVQQGQALLQTVYNCLDHYTHPQIIAANSLVPTGRNMLSAGVMTIAVGATMTVAPNSYWRIV